MNAFWLKRLPRFIRIKLDGRHGFQAIIANSGWLFAERILRMVVGLLVGVWVARYLGPDQFGMLSYAQSFVGIFSVITTLGLNGIVVRDLVRDEQNRDQLLGSVFFLKIVAAIVVLLLLSIAVQFTSNDSAENTLIFIIGFSLVFQAFNVLDLYFQAKSLNKYVVFANTVCMLAATAIKIGLIVTSAPLISFAAVAVFESIVVSAGLIYFYSCKKLSLRNWKVDFGLGGNLLRESWPLIMVGVASMINMRIDQIMLANMLDNETVGNYAAAVRIAEIWLVLPALLGSSIFPALVRAKEEGITVYHRKILTTVKYMAYFTIPVALIISGMSGLIVDLLYGEKYSAAGKYLMIYIWTGVPYLIFFQINSMIYIDKLAKLSVYVTVFSVVINIVLNTQLIPIFGGIGAVYATLITTIITTVVSLWLINSRTGVFSKKHIGRNT